MKPYILGNNNNTVWDPFSTRYLTYRPSLLTQLKVGYGLQYSSMSIYLSCPVLVRSEKNAPMGSTVAYIPFSSDFAFFKQL